MEKLPSWKLLSDGLEGWQTAFGLAGTCSAIWFEPNNGLWVQVIANDVQDLKNRVLAKRRELGHYGSPKPKAAPKPAEPVTPKNPYERSFG